MLTEEERIARVKKAAAAFDENLKQRRPGFGTVLPIKSAELSKDIARQVELSELQWVKPDKLTPNPANPYTPLSESQLAELAEDIKAKGVLVPLIVRLQDTEGKSVIVCGYNRHAAAKIAGADQVPIQRILTPLTPELEAEIMRSENKLRRGGEWTAEQKRAWVETHFGDEIKTAEHGGKRTEAGRTKNQASVKLEKKPNKTAGLASRIETASRGKIAKGTADRIVADLRNGTTKPGTTNTGKSTGKAGPPTALRDFNRYLTGAVKAIEFCEDKSAQRAALKDLADRRKRLAKGWGLKA